DDGVGCTGHEVAELGTVRAVDHPGGLGDLGGNGRAKLVGVGLGPIGAMVDGVELDVRNIKPPSHLGGQGGLARPTGADDPNPLHTPIIGVKAPTGGCGSTGTRL